MTIRTINAGWEAIDYTSSSGSIAYNSNFRTYGRGCTRFGPSGAGTAAAIVAGYAANGNVAVFDMADGWVTWHGYFDDFPDSNNEIICRIVSGASTRKYDIEINSTGALSVTDRVGTAFGTGSTLLNLSTSYRFAARGGNGTSAPFELWVAPDGAAWPGAAELSGNIDQGNTQFDRVQLGKAGNKFSQTIGYSIQDVVVDDAQKWGHYYIGVALPIANGSQWDFTGSYADLDEHPHDGETTEISASATGNRAMCDMTSGADMGIGAGDTIPGILAYNVRDGSRVGTANEVARVTIDVNGNRAQTTGVNLALVGYVMGAKVQLTNPDGGGAWTRAAIDAMEIGGGPDANVLMHLTAVRSYVMFVPSATGRPSARTIHIPRFMPGLEL